MKSTTARNARRRRTATFAAAALLSGTALVAITVSVAPDQGAVSHPRPQYSPQAVAQAQAKATGRPVPVDAATTAYTSTVANPNGSFTFTSNLSPTVVRRGRAWVPVDATLRAAADGSLAPAAVESSVRLSGGGNTPLASLDDGAGHRLELSMPMSLPKPTTVGDTATYAGVLPGVDLSVTATVYGGTREVLIVRDAAAAANPALRNLRLSAKTTGLTLSPGPERPRR
jgi:hypothetical protein